MTTLATKEDVQAVMLRELSNAEERVISPLLEEAENKLRVKFPAFDKFAADGAKRAVLVAAERNAVKRVLMNPDMARTIAETVGPFSRSVTLDTAISSGALYIDDKDVQGLIPRKRKVRSFHLKAGM